VVYRMQYRDRYEFLASVAMRLASKCCVKPKYLKQLTTRELMAVHRIANRIVRLKGSSKYCTLCNVGPYHPRALYNHYWFGHRDEIISMIKKELGVQDTLNVDKG